MINDSDLAAGYAVGHYSSSAVTIIKKIQNIVLDLMHEKFPNSSELSLERYHEITGLNDATHEDFHFEATKVLHSLGLVRSLMDTFKTRRPRRKAYGGSEFKYIVYNVYGTRK